MEKKIKYILDFTRLGYVIGCTVLYLIAIWIIVCAVYGIAFELYHNTFTVYHLLDEVGLLVFSIAVIDVVKYLTIEEIIKHGKERKLHEEKKNLTKFVMIISTALALEGLVLTIETAKTNLNQLLYPIMLLLVAVFFILSVGIYQKLTVNIAED
jgi:hypothetical protein